MTESITVQKYSSIGEAYNAFKMGNVDIINTGMTDYQQYIGTMGYNIKTYTGRSYEYIAFNCNDSILGDKAVRRAINYAINKDTINTSVFYGNKIVSNGFLDYGSFLYNGENLISYDQEKAKQELLNNGWSNADGTWKKDDKTIDINIVVNNDNQDRINVARNIKNQLSEIGIKVHVKEVSRDRYNQYRSDKNYDMMLCGVNNSISPGLNSFYGSGNIANYSCDEQLDSIEGIRNAQRKANEEVPYIGLYRNKWTIILHPSVGGELKPNAYGPYNNFDRWYRQL
jgi:peptide/nickel transport system substrate-binding protein